MCSNPNCKIDTGYCTDCWVWRRYLSGEGYAPKHRDGKPRVLR
jgi:hypothetical protein